MALDRHGQTNTNSSSWEAYKECSHWRKTLGILLSLAVHICRIPILNNAGWTEKNESQTTFQSNIKPLLPKKHGWKMTEGPGFEPLWSTKPTMSSAVTEFVQCGCKICTLCIDNHCSCQKNNRFCSDSLCNICTYIPMLISNPDFRDDYELSQSDCDSEIE